MIIQDARSESTKVIDHVYVALCDGDSLKVIKFEFLKGNNPLRFTDDTMIRGYKWAYLK